MFFNRAVCNKTWLHDTSLYVIKTGVSCEKIGLLCSRSRAQQRLENFIDFPDSIFWTVEPFVTKWSNCYFVLKKMLLRVCMVCVCMCMCMRALGRKGSRMFVSSVLVVACYSSFLTGFHEPPSPLS